MSNLFSGIKNGKKLIKRFFLVDFENVQSHGLAGLSELKDTDAVTVYFSKNADSISFELHMALNECSAKTEFIKVGTGVKNALDFQLSSQLGYIINQNIVSGNRSVKYYIISMDNGFTCLRDFWEKFGADVSIVRSIANVVEPRDGDPYAEVFNELMLSETDEAAVTQAIESCPTTADLHNRLQSILKDPKKVTEVYHAIKPIFGKDSEKAGECA